MLWIRFCLELFNNPPRYRQRLLTTVIVFAGILYFKTPVRDSRDLLVTHVTLNTVQFELALNCRAKLLKALGAPCKLSAFIDEVGVSAAKLYLSPSSRLIV